MVYDTQTNKEPLKKQFMGGKAGRNTMHSHQWGL